MSNHKFVSSMLVSVWLLFIANSSILQLHHHKNKLIFNDMMVGYGLY